MKFLIKAFCFCFFLVSQINLHAQHTELGFGGGIAFYTGELNPSPNPMNKLKPTVSLFLRKNLNYRYSLRFRSYYSKLAATDSKNTRENLLFFETRNYAFSSTLMDIYGILEFNFIPYQINNPATSKFTPYIFIGMAGFYTNPEVEHQLFDGSHQTPLTSFAIPFGFGIKTKFVLNMGLNLEWTYRKTYSDLVDGLNDKHFNLYQLSNSRNNDWYSFITISLSYKFLRKTDKCSFPIN